MESGVLELEVSSSSPLVLCVDESRSSVVPGVELELLSSWWMSPVESVAASFDSSLAEVPVVM